jgi:glycosyltransferase EpsF
MDVYRHMDRERVQFDFLTYSEGPGYFDKEIASLGGRVFAIPPPDPRHLFSHVGGMWGVFRRQGPFAAVHSHGAHYSGLAVAVARLARIPIRICHARTAPPKVRGNLLRRAYFFCSKASMLVNASHLLACSRSAGRFLFGRLGMVDRRFRIVRNAIDAGKFACVDPASRIRMRMSWGANDSTLVIGHVGRFMEVKNHGFLLELASALARERKDSVLVLAGDGLLRKGTENAASAAGLTSRVVFLGARSDVPDILSAIDCLLLPSKYEGVPGVVVEAQAAGLSCLVSDRVTREVDVGLGLVGFLPIDQGVGIWVRYLEDIRSRLGDRKIIEAAFRESGYDIRDTAEILEGIYLP